MICSPNGLMRYNNGIFAIVDDIPLLSQWIKKLRTSIEVLNFLEVAIGFDNLLRLRLECWWLVPHHFSLKTVPRTVFLTLEPKGSNPHFIHFKKKNPSVWMGFLFGGGNRI